MKTIVYIITNSQYRWWLDKSKHWVDCLDNIDDDLFGNSAVFRSKRKAYNCFFDCPKDSVMEIHSKKRNKIYYRSIIRI